jgi:hypothetical protein
MKTLHNQVRKLLQKFFKLDKVQFFGAAKPRGQFGPNPTAKFSAAPEEYTKKANHMQPTMLRPVSTQPSNLPMSP